ncbi:MAG: AAA family ATPase [Thiopseudomonas sp.]|nr:AAA family ATPase [Thiopseudomonas sp.]
MTLSLHQQQAADPILRILTSQEPETHQCVLAGYAGSGKTFLAGFIAQALLNENYSVMAITHAHKALSVIASKLPAGVETGTVFSALGWRVNIKTGIPTESGQHRLVGIDVLIVDEASMIDQRMYNAMQRLSQNLGFKILFIGDPAQLPPVGFDESPVFNLVEKQFRLTEIVRQEKDSPIIKASMYVRGCLEKLERPDIHAMQVAAGDGDAIQITTGGVTAIASFVQSAIDHGLDCRSVGFTNKSVNQVNDIVSRYFHPPGSPRIAVNDPVTFGSSMIKDNVTIAPTDSIGKAKTIEMIGKHGCMDIDCLKIELVLDGGKEVECITPADIDSYGSKLRNWKKQLSSCNSAAKQATEPDKIAELYERRGQLAILVEQCNDDYADLRHTYASTAHKAQGSTFDVAIVDWADMQRNADIAMLCRLLYVAVTRPSRYLVVVV